MSERDGGPAFPTFGHHDGMTLRDFFAAQALRGLVIEMAHKIASDDNAVQALFNTARLCYVAADAMLEARKR